jgi:hypothetical protein
MVVERRCLNDGCGAEMTVEERKVNIKLEMGKVLCDECKKWLTEVVK